MRSKNKSKKARLKRTRGNNIFGKEKVLHSRFHYYVRQRLKRDRNNGHAGHKTPMKDVEPYLVELIKKLAEMGTPFHCFPRIRACQFPHCRSIC
jgi:hypothetical protein